jgi:tetratricopeptide (TPR) repeat protein
MGHTAAARLYGIHVNTIVLWPLGGVANLSRRPEKVLPDLVISAAGPLANFVIFAGFGILTVLVRLLERSMLSPQLSLMLIEWDAFSFLASLTIANLSLAVFNLVPIYPLDGGQIARGLIKLVFGEKWADRIMLMISLPAAFGLVIAGVVVGDVLLILTGLLLVLASASLNTHVLNGLTLLVLFFIDRGGYYLKRSDYDPAVREYTRAIQRSPNRAGLYVSRAVVYMNLLEYQRTREDVEKALLLEPESFIAWALRGELDALKKDYTAALQSFDRSIEIRPTWSIAYLDRGSLFQERGDLPRALEDVNRAMDLNRGSPIAAVMRSMLRFQMGDLKGAREDAETALRYAPNWMLVFPEVFLLNLDGHLDWALDYYGRAIERMPNAAQSYQGRADAYRANHHPGWAIEDYSQAIKLSPRLAELYLCRGLAFQAVDAADKAFEDFQQAARLADKSHIRRQALAQVNGLESPILPAGEASGSAGQSAGW